MLSIDRSRAPKSEDIRVGLNILIRLFFKFYADFRVELNIQVYGNWLLGCLHLNLRRASAKSQKCNDTGKGKVTAGHEVQIPSPHRTPLSDRKPL